MLLFLPRKRTTWWRKLAWGCLVAGVLSFAAEAFHVLLGSNFHVVVPGKVYRCAQQTPDDLEQLIKAYGIRTVLNLRGCCPDCSWYLEECRVTHRLNVSQEDIILSAGRFPSTTEMRRLVEVLDHTEYPILIHCRRGADRTGLVSAVILLLQKETTLERARKQLSLRFGHIPIGRPKNLDRYLDLYENWLISQKRSHSSETFREWLQLDHCPGHCIARIEALDFPERIKVGRPQAFSVRVCNLGRETWRFQRESNAGVHAVLSVWDANGCCLAMDWAGLFDAVVLPGQSIDLTFAVPSINVPGHHRVVVNMIDAAHCLFFQVGSEPLERDLIVEP
ncbi:MAG: hypothetical protein KatS3mg105_4135 [Gemmatales bacterium]|nr:MAG: hypothetical protein KatS3mg105_4135 [Gemmatales bacterium]